MKKCRLVAHSETQFRIPRRTRNYALLSQKRLIAWHEEAAVPVSASNTHLNEVLEGNASERKKPDDDDDVGKKKLEPEKRRAKRHFSYFMAD